MPPGLLVASEEDAIHIVNLDVALAITHIISIGDSGSGQINPGTRNYLRMTFLDVGDVGESWALSNGYEIPQEEHVQNIIEFSKTITQNSQVLIHCMQGISRSPAAAIILLLAITKGNNINNVVRYVYESCLRGITKPNTKLLSLCEDVFGLQSGKIKDVVKEYSNIPCIVSPYSHWHGPRVLL